MLKFLLFRIMSNLIDSTSIARLRFQQLLAWKTAAELLIPSGTKTVKNVVVSMDGIIAMGRVDHSVIAQAIATSGSQATIISDLLNDPTALEDAIDDLILYFEIDELVNTVAPVVSGLLTVGDTLTSTTGTWTAWPAATFAYQWQRLDGTWANIVGATAATRVLSLDDEQHDVRCVVTATNLAGSVSVNSNAVGPILP